MKKVQGLTLLELLATVAIVAILAAVAIPGFSKMVERAKVRDAETTLNAIFQAERIYRLDQTPLTYGTLDDLVNHGYFTNPNANPNWLFRVPQQDTNTFTAEATRTGGSHVGNCLKIRQTGTMCQNGFDPPLTNPGAVATCGDGDGCTSI